MGYFSTLPIARFFPRFEGLSRVFLRLNVSFMSHYWIIIMWHLFQHSLSHNHRYQCNEGNWNRSRTAVVTLLVFVTFISITKANIFVFLKVSFENRVQWVLCNGTFHWFIYPIYLSFMASFFHCWRFHATFQPILFILNSFRS